MTYIASSRRMVNIPSTHMMFLYGPAIVRNRVGKVVKELILNGIACVHWVDLLFALTEADG